MKKIKVPIEICREGVNLPEYKNINDAGMDVQSTEELIICSGETIIVPTGLKVAIPEGYEIQVRPRSGLSLKTPLRIANSPGTIDTGYRDEIGIIITNTGRNNHKIFKCDRIAQLVLKEVPQIEWEIVDDVKSIGINRNGGFGSTGVN
jgi:dUTP pyrophosphatase